MTPLPTQHYATSWARHDVPAAPLHPLAEVPVHPSSCRGMSPETRELLKRVGEARRHVSRAYPPAVAATLDDELNAFVEIGARYGSGRRVAQLVEEILAAPLRVPRRPTPSTPPGVIAPNIA